MSTKWNIIHRRKWDSQTSRMKIHRCTILGCECWEYNSFGWCSSKHTYSGLTHTHRHTNVLFSLISCINAPLNQWCSAQGWLLGWLESQHLQTRDDVCLFTSSQPTWPWSGSSPCRNDTTYRQSVPQAGSRDHWSQMLSLCDSMHFFTLVVTQVSTFVHVLSKSQVKNRNHSWRERGEMTSEVWYQVFAGFWIEAKTDVTLIRLQTPPQTIHRNMHHLLFMNTLAGTKALRKSPPITRQAKFLPLFGASVGLY